ncbi:MAG: hypothetical protein ABSH46_20580 [Bryobacteraceae bacterium]
MKRLLVVSCVLAAGLAAPLFGEKGNQEGKLWLDAWQVGAEANVNVSGTWTAKGWGKVTLEQKEGARELAGMGDGWDVLGWVSGNRVYLIFSSKGVVGYLAELTADGPNTLNGVYRSGLRFSGTATRPMQMTK